MLAASKCSLESVHAAQISLNQVSSAISLRIGLGSGSDVIWGFERLVWQPGEMEFGSVAAVYGVASSLQSEKKTRMACKR